MIDINLWQCKVGVLQPYGFGNEIKLAWGVSATKYQVPSTSLENVKYHESLLRRV